MLDEIEKLQLREDSDSYANIKNFDPVGHLKVEVKIWEFAHQRLKLDESSPFPSFLPIPPSVTRMSFLMQLIYTFHFQLRNIACNG